MLMLGRNYIALLIHARGRLIGYNSQQVFKWAVLISKGLSWTPHSCVPESVGRCTVVAQRFRALPPPVTPVDEVESPVVTPPPRSRVSKTPKEEKSNYLIQFIYYHT